MTEVKAVIFDMDGVIFDTESLWKRVFLEANQKFGISLTEAYRQSICGKNEAVIREELKELLPDLDSEIYRNYIINGVHEAIATGNFAVKRGFDNLVRALRKKNYIIALATASDRNRAEKMFQVKRYQPESIFDAMVFGDEVGIRSKPDPYLFQLAADKLKILPEHCLVLEDSVNGIMAAKRGGFIPVMVVDLIEPDDYCKRHCRLIARSLEEVTGNLLGAVVCSKHKA